MSTSVKTRFSSLDTMAMCSELEATAGRKLANVYDIDEKTYLLKFSVPGESEKPMIIIESGIRVHPTRFLHDKSAMPSSFSMKLRKHLKGKRLDGVQQLGMDRVIDIRFGSGDAAHHLLVELYSAGNIVLTDETYQVLALLRTHQFDEETVLKIGEPYPINFATTVATSDAPAEGATSVLDMTPAQFQVWASDKEAEHGAWHEAQTEKSKKKTRKMFLRQALLAKGTGVSDLGPELLDHCLLKCAGAFSNSTKLEDVARMEWAAIAGLLASLVDGRELFLSLKAPGKQNGFVVYDGQAYEGLERYVEFTPVLLEQHVGKRVKEVEGFAEAVDEYYSKIKEQKLEQEVLAMEENARKKIEKVKQARMDQIDSIAAKQKRLELSAGLVEVHAAEIDKLQLVLNSALGNGMSWDEIQVMVDNETANGNAIASLVVALHLQRNAVTVRLKNYNVDSDDSGTEDDNDNEDKSSVASTANSAYVDVEIDLTVSAHANARNMFQNKKLARVNEDKTVNASIRAVNSVEEQIMKQLVSQKVQKCLKAARKVHWFEKFAWFVTTEGYLVISGRDALQNEIIVSKYMRPDDVYIHADVPGASLCLLRRKPKTDVASTAAAAPISPYAIHETGNFCMCRSSVWVSKVVTSPWWVFGSQVSKIAPNGTGDMLPRGVFAISGSRSYLPPMPMELGFGIMWRLDEASAARHKNDRKDKDAYVNDDMMSVVSDAMDRYGLESIEEPVGPALAVTNAPQEKGKGKGKGKGKKQKGEGDKGKNDAEDDVVVAVDSISLDIDGGEEDDKEVAASFRDEEGEQEAGQGGEEEEEEEEEKKPGKNKLGKAKVKKAEKVLAAQAEKDKNPGQEVPKKKKKIDKKKARRYAEQDEEDRELAMQSLGHGKTGEKLKDKVAQMSKEVKEMEKAKKLDRVGISDFVKTAAASVQEQVPAVIRARLEDLSSSEVIAEGEIAVEHLSTLSAFSDAEGLEILQLFESGLQDKTKSGGSKSAFLAAIMQRYRREKENQKKEGTKDKQMVKKAASSAAELASESEGEQVDGGSERVADDADLLDADELSFDDDIDSITGHPTPEDVILYAIPCCGPFSAIKQFKFRVKIAPGNLKKGKVAKTAIMAFTNNAFVSPQEKNCMNSLTEVEMASTLVAEIKINMPGLNLVKHAGNKQRGQRQNGSRR